MTWFDFMVGALIAVVIFGVLPAVLRFAIDWRNRKMR